MLSDVGTLPGTVCKPWLDNLPSLYVQGFINTCKTEVFYVGETHSMNDSTIIMASIRQLFDIGVVDGRIFKVTEFVESGEITFFFAFFPPEQVVLC